MSQLFPKSANKFAILSIIGGLLSVGGLITIGMLYVRSPMFTKQGIERTQPIAFSHEVHANQLKMDCRYCHTTVETSSFANIPDTETCLKCHSVVKKDSPLIAPLVQSKESGMPIEWVRVHDLPDHVYFNHSIHVAKGIACTTCHGQIDQMDTVFKENTLLMQWCIECHKHPDVNVRPSTEVTNMNFESIEQVNKEMTFGNIAVEQGHDLAVYKTYLEQIREGKPYDARDYVAQDVRKPIHCSACHR